MSPSLLFFLLLIIILLIIIVIIIITLLLLLTIIIIIILIIMYWLIGKIISTLAVFSSNQFQLSKVGAAPREKEIKLVDMGADVKEY